MFDPKAKYIYTVNPLRGPIHGLSCGDIRVHKSAKLNLDDVKKCLGKGTISRRFFEEDRIELVTPSNCERLHNEKFISEEEWYIMNNTKADEHYEDDDETSTASAPVMSAESPNVNGRVYSTNVLESALEPTEDSNSGIVEISNNDDEEPAVDEGHEDDKAEEEPVKTDHTVEEAYNGYKEAVKDMGIEETGLDKMPKEFMGNNNHNNNQNYNRPKKKKH